MAWQREWTGPRLYNKRFLVHKDELDKPQEQFRSLVLPPDPIPIMNARPEPYAMDEGGPSDFNDDFNNDFGPLVFVRP